MLDKEGTSYNNGETSEMAVSHSMANVNQYYLPPQLMKGWRSPGYVNKLPAFMAPPPPGDVKEAAEVATDDIYYNGSYNLGQDCYGYAKTQCYYQVNCGWCFATRSCVQGDSNGPIATCPKGYVYRV